MHDDFDLNYWQHLQYTNMLHISIKVHACSTMITYRVVLNLIADDYYLLYSIYSAYSIYSGMLIDQHYYAIASKVSFYPLFLSCFYILNDLCN